MLQFGVSRVCCALFSVLCCVWSLYVQFCGVCCAVWCVLCAVCCSVCCVWCVCCVVCELCVVLCLVCGPEVTASCPPPLSLPPHCNLCSAQVGRTVQVQPTVDGALLCSLIERTLVLVYIYWCWHWYTSLDWREEYGVTR